MSNRYIAGDINLYGLSLTSLPEELADINVFGNLNAIGNRFTSFKNFPANIFSYKESPIKLSRADRDEGTGRLTLDKNKITSFEGAPKFVNQDLTMSENKLTDLVGMPEIKYGSFFCRKNNLTSLQGCIPSLYQSFDVSVNPGLTSLKNGPKKVGATYTATNCNIKNLDMQDCEFVALHLDLRANKITTLEGLPQIIEGTLYIGDNPIAESIISDLKRLSNLPSHFDKGYSIKDYMLRNFNCNVSQVNFTSKAWQI